MSLVRSLFDGLRSLFRKEHVSQELDEELNGFLEMAAEEKMRQGMSRKDALRAVRLERGSLEVTKEVVRSAGWESFVETLWQDLCFAARMLRKNPGFASTVILTLGLGIGLNSAIFTVASGFLLREPPVKDPPNVVVLTMVNPAESWDRSPVTPTEFSALRKQLHLFEGMAAVLIENLPLIGPGDPESVTVAGVTSNYFALIGVPARLGAQSFSASEQRVLSRTRVIVPSLPHDTLVGILATPELASA